MSESEIKEKISDEIADIIAEKAEPLVSGQEGLRTLKVLEAIQTACRTGGLVKINGTQNTEIKEEEGVT
mgnify:CR=1 FL=1